ncbi:hypothetical protein KVR01_011818 [Diaporthe batatas]|uniref:uncharacterized protein n=1 Tax=Diaporthe batatas TaxID=748121 RepID=UPI001D04BD0D|nr:uncharacterized protein KVR01_011818 [Diaporthe batatas]KAG8158057.1 hypothetical protein KVR01_011818 [Diaporthe batatas]
MQAPPPTERVDMRHPDGGPFGQVFAGENHTKLPAPELLRVQAQQLEKARGLGYSPKTKAGQGDDTVAAAAAGGGGGEGGGGFYGAAFLSLGRFSEDPEYGPGTKFHDYVLQRLVDAAEASRDLPEFLHALNPGVTCRKTETGQEGRFSWEVYYGGVIRMYPGPGPICAKIFVDFFISNVEGDWDNAEGEQAWWDDELENEGGDAEGGKALAEDGVESEDEVESEVDFEMLSALREVFIKACGDSKRLG